MITYDNLLPCLHILINQKEGFIMPVYKVIELIGTSENSWEEAASEAITRASKTVDDLRIAQVVSQDLKIEGGKVIAYRTKLSLSFKFREG